MTELRIGISGWTYPLWRGTFYPPGLTQNKELEFASRQVNSIEVNGTFYAMQRPEIFRRWYAETPDDFVFSVKAGRYMTHIRRLYDIESPLANFFGSGILDLKEKLGPILWQFPPSMKYDRARFEDFFALLPRDTRGAAKLAAKHSPWMKWADTEAHGKRALRHAVEIRNKSFENPEFVDLLRSNDIALVFADTAGKWPYLEEVTSDFIYIRLHGKGKMYVGGYDERSIESWASRVKKWSAKRSVFVYFDNDVKVHAPFNAIALAERLLGSKFEINARERA